MSKVGVGNYMAYGKKLAPQSYLKTKAGTTLPVYE